MKIAPCFHRVSIKGLVVDERNKFLLMQEENGFWDLPGGGMDHGEDPEICLKREIQEEMGLEVTYMDSHPKYFFPSTNPIGQPIVNVVYHITLSNFAFKASNECIALRFFSPAEVKEMERFMYPNVLAFSNVFE